MEFKINCSPHLRMCDITKQLFNRNFHSDVQFCVEGKLIYAHSFELIKRSVVFQQQFEESRLGAKQLIPIVDCKYEFFFEFMRFIYTDECELNKTNAYEILKLAIQYKIIMLENKVINYVTYSMELRLKLFEHCVVNKYQLIHNTIYLSVVDGLGQHLRSKHFLTLHPDAVEELLKFDRIRSGVTEAEIFTALVKWIMTYCETHRMSLLEGRQQFDSLIRKIRFPVMPIEDLRECAKKNLFLINSSDRASIAWQIVFGDSYNEEEAWIARCREEYNPPYEWRPFNWDTVCETQLSVSRDTILHGIRIGNCSSCVENQIELEIFTKNREQIIFRLSGGSWWDLTVNFGDSLRLKSNCEYTITVKYLLDVEEDSKKLVLHRKEGIDAIVNDVTNSVRILQISSNVLEMFFKSPEIE